VDPALRFGNRFLSSLAAEDFELIRPHLRVAELPREHILLRTGDILEQVYFPHSGVLSLVLPLSKGETIEIALIGRDSTLGAFAALGEAVSLSDVFVLITGIASIMDVDRLRAATEMSSRLRTTLVKHQQALFVQAQQTAGCNASHSVEARVARWLLRARDLAGSDRLDLTQELMAQMIGARRNSVSIVAHTLQQSNFIRYSRGHIDIVDPIALARSCCECYEAVRMQYERLIG
jgi:CRP-like cAMP-binding protein